MDTVIYIRPWMLRSLSIMMSLQVSWNLIKLLAGEISAGQ